MPLRPRARSAAVLLALVTAAALAGCSDDAAEPGGTPAATAAPTAVGDRPLVEVVEPGAEPRRVLSLDLEQGSTADASLTLVQRVVADQQPTTVPPITVPMEVAVAQADADRIETTQTFGRPTIDGTGARPADVTLLTQRVAVLAGSTSELVVRPDGTTLEARRGVAAAGQIDAQLRSLVPVLPTEEVGVGASWTVTAVAEVEGATVDQVSTYTLESLDGDAYVIGVGVEQTYRPGTVAGVELRSGRGVVSARLAGSLGRLLPDEGSADVSTQVSYVVGGRVSEVGTTLSVDVTGG